MLINEQGFLRNQVSLHRASYLRPRGPKSESNSISYRMAENSAYLEPLTDVSIRILEI